MPASVYLFSMFVIDLHYIVPLEQIDAHMKAHMAFLKKFYDNKTFLTSGRKVPRTGGIIIAVGNALEEVEQIIKQDPFVTHGLATYTITQFQTSQMQPELKRIIG